MKLLEGHKVNSANDTLTVAAFDKPGAGGAHHGYVIAGFDASGNPASQVPAKAGLRILFQNGAIGEVGVNGVTHEALIAILVDRLQCFQAGKFANPYNEKALAHLQAAQKALQDRTRERMSRGVEGTLQK